MDWRLVARTMGSPPEPAVPAYRARRLPWRALAGPWAGPECSESRRPERFPVARSARPTADGYAPLPFFAKNLPIPALVWSRKRCWLFLARATIVGACRVASKKSLTTDRHASRTRFDVGREA